MKMYILKKWDGGRLLVINRRDCKFGYTPPVDMMDAERTVNERNAWAVRTYGTDEVESCLCGQHNPPVSPDYTPAEISDALFDIDHHPDNSSFWDSPRGRESSRIAHDLKLEPETPEYFRTIWHREAMRAAHSEDAE
jgi:hypothetical protein